MTIRQTIIEAIRESWSGDDVPEPYGLYSHDTEYSRGQFELAILLLGYDGHDDMEEAARALHAEVIGTSGAPVDMPGFEGLSETLTGLTIRKVG